MVLLYDYKLAMTCKQSNKRITRKGAVFMANTTTDKNVTMVRKEDKNFIRSMMSLPQDKKILIQGILIGLELQEKQTATAAR